MKPNAKQKTVRRQDSAAPLRLVLPVALALVLGSFLGAWIMAAVGTPAPPAPRLAADADEAKSPSETGPPSPSWTKPAAAKIPPTEEPGAALAAAHSEDTAAGAEDVSEFFRNPPLEQVRQRTLERGRRIAAQLESELYRAPRDPLVEEWIENQVAALRQLIPSLTDLEWLPIECTAQLCRASVTFPSAERQREQEPYLKIAQSSLGGETFIWTADEGPPRSDVYFSLEPGQISAALGRTDAAP